jgi:hypothetical protein
MADRIPEAERAKRDAALFSTGTPHPAYLKSVNRWEKSEKKCPSPSFVDLAS